MDNTTIGFIIGIVVGLLMGVYPNFVLFRPSRKGQWLYSILGDKKWTMMVRGFGILLFIGSGYFFLVPFE